jgi:sodium-independent sulfate anion transporter 11
MAASDDTKIRAAKAFGIDASRREEPIPTVDGVDIYAEDDPTVQEWFAEITPSLHDVGRYIYKLFPFLSWIGKYNLTWFVGDLIAGEYNHSFGDRAKSPSSAVYTSG